MNEHTACCIHRSKTSPAKSWQSGFTLVELSVVLVILGLLVGGVLTGQALIRSAQLRSITSQYRQFVAATQSFKGKYGALPGDMDNAQSFWGIADATPLTCVTTPSTDTKTCNGNADGKIYDNNSSNEMFRFWQHLANATLIQGNYDGVAHGTVDSAANSLNSPEGKIKPGLWYAFYWGERSNSNILYDGDYGNTLQFGAAHSNGHPYLPLLRTEEAWNIDVKLDDGKPAIGNIVIIGTISNATTNCSDGSSTSALDANYRLMNKKVSCALVFRNVF